MEKKRYSKVYISFMVIIFFVALGFLLAISTLLYSTALNLNILHSEMETIVNNTNEINTNLKKTNEGMNIIIHENLHIINNDMKKINTGIEKINKKLEGMGKDLKGVDNELSESWIL